MGTEGSWERGIEVGDGVSRDSEEFDLDAPIMARVKECHYWAIATTGRSGREIEDTMHYPTREEAERVLEKAIATGVVLDGR